MQPRLVHQAEEPQGSQRHGLAAGIGTRDQQSCVVAAEPDIDRDDTSGQARMARTQEHDLRSIRDLGRDRVHLLSQTGLRRPEVEPGQRFEGLPERTGLPGDYDRQLVEDSLDLGLLGHLRLAPGVAHFDRDERLHEQRLATTRSVVDDALDPAAGVGPDRDDVPAAAESHDGLLQRPGKLARMDELVEPGPQAVIGDADRATETSEPRRGRVEQLAGRVEAALEGIAQVRKSVDLSGQVSQQRTAVAAQGVAEARRRLQSYGDVEEVRRVQPAAAHRPLDPGPDVLAAADTCAGVPGDKRPSLRRLLQASGDDDRLGGGLQRLGETAARRESRGCRQTRPDERVLEQSQRAAVEAADRRLRGRFVACRCLSAAGCHGVT